MRIFLGEHWVLSHHIFDRADAWFCKLYPDLDFTDIVLYFIHLIIHCRLSSRYGTADTAGIHYHRATR